MNKNTRHIDKLRFRLFEIGIQITEKQAEFQVAKAKQTLLKINSLNNFRVAPYYSAMLKTSVSTIKTIDDYVIKHALSMSYKAYLPRTKQNTVELSQIELEQLATPTAEQIRHHVNKCPFELRDFLQFSSQFQSKVNLLWCGIHKSLVNAQNAHYMEMLWRFFPQQMMQWCSDLQAITLDAKAYLPLIVHPWQFKHVIIKEFKEKLHEKLIIGPLTKQSAYPLFDPNHLIMENYSNPFLKTALFNPPLSSPPVLQKKLSKILQKEHFFNQQLFCLEEEPLLNLETGCNCLNSRLIHSPNVFLDRSELVVPLVSLVNPSYLLDKPLLMTIIDDKPAHFLSLFETLLNLYLKTHMLLLRQYRLIIDSDIEHLLIAFKNNKPTKIIYRSPNVIGIQKHHLATMDNLQIPLKKILNCYFYHSGDKHTYHECMHKLQKALEFRVL